MKIKYLMMTTVGAALMASPAFAQSAESETTNDSNDIVVTANKREQSVNDVGLTIQAASGEDLIDRGVSGPEDLGKLVSGFTFTQSIYSTPVYTLRGIGLYDATFGAAPSVSVYNDQIPRNVPVMSDGLDLDVERVEVLKGPQGTLFGQSSTGGAINYIVGKPTKETEAGFNASFERFGRLEIGGYVSGPMGDFVQARLAVKNVSGGAWQRSVTRPDDENGDTRKFSGRLSFDVQPSDSVNISLSATVAHDRSDPLAPQYSGSLFNIYGTQAQLTASGNPYGYVDAARYAQLTNPTSAGYDGSFAGRQAVLEGRLASTNPAISAGARAILGTPVSTNARDAEWTDGLMEGADNRYAQAAGRVDIDLTGTITLTSITAFAKKTLQYNQDLDGTAAVVADVPLYGNVKTFNQEIRLSGNSEGLNWIIGGSYDNVQTSQNNFFRLTDYSGNLGLITLTLNNFDSRSRSFGLFGNVEYEISPNFTILGGIRYTKTKLDATYCYNDPAQDTAQGTAALYGSALNSVPITILPGQCFPTTGDLLLGTAASTLAPVDQAMTEDNISFRAGANYKTDSGLLVYGTVSQGYKAGIFSAIGASRVLQYTPAVQEKVVAYEAGVKAPLAGGAVQINAATFYYDYSDKQVRGRINDPVFGLLEKMVNVPKSYVLGFEAELVVNPFDGLRISASGTYLKAKVDGTFNQTADGNDVFNAAGFKGDFDGAVLPYTPKFSGNVDAQYEFPLSGSMNGFFGGTVLFQGSQNATFANSALPADDFKIDSYTTLDLRAGLGAQDGSWKVSVYGRNVTDESYVTAISTYLDTALRYRGKPAVYGVSVNLKY